MTPGTVKTEGYTLEEALASVPTGWSKLVTEAFSLKPENIKIVQVKEKFGSLRIYAESKTENDNLSFRFDGVLRVIEEMSQWVCKNCNYSCGCRG